MVPGRPLSGRDAAICAATLELLAEVGYDRMSMDSVAARARASKATIYRRWPGKRELVLEALHRRHEQAGEAPDTGSLRGALVAAFAAMTRAAGGQDADLMAGVLRAMRAAPEIGSCLRDQVIDSKRRVIQTVVDRAVTRGELAPGARADLAHEVAGALWVQRVLVVGAQADDAFITHVVDDVILPLLRASGSPAPVPTALATEEKS